MVKDKVHHAGVDYYYVFKINLIEGDKFTEVKSWCDSHCKGNWSLSSIDVWFDKKTDATLFSLTWI